MKLLATPAKSRNKMRRFLIPAIFVGLLSVSAPAFAQPDLIITIDMTIPPGTYHNIEIRPGINATVGGEVTVTGSFQIDSAGAAAISGLAHIDGNLFRLMDDAKLTIQNAEGVDGVLVGPIRTVTKNFGTKARITFSSAVTAQVTGPGFPDEVSELVINNPFGVTLSRALGVRERLHLRNGSLITDGQTLTLISRVPDITMVTAASALIYNQNLTGQVVGNVTAQRYINPRYNTGTGYRHFSSSVTGTGGTGGTVADLTTPGFTPVVNPQYNTVPYNIRFIAGNVLPYPNAFFYDETQVGTGGPGTSDAIFRQGYQSPASLTAPLGVMQGITVRIPANQTVDFVGQPNNGPMDSGPLSSGSLPESGWHLMGNPYPSKIDWTLLTMTNMYDQLSKYRSLTLTEGVYDTYVNGISTGPSGSEFIAANQAVFVRVFTPGLPGNVHFENSARIIEFRDDPTAPFFRGTAAAQARPLVRLALEGVGSLHDEAVVYFEQNATTGIDPAYDGFYLNAGNHVGIYSPVGTETLSINGLPALLPTTDYTVPLVVNAWEAGAYTLRAAEALNFPAGFAVLLQDAVTGVSQDLTLNPAFSFTTASRNATNTRFSVRFRAGGVTGLNETAGVSNFDVYPNPMKGGERLNLVVTGVQAGTTVSAVLYNQVGQPVWNAPLRAELGGIRTSVALPLPGGVYTLRVVLPDGARQSRRVIVN